MNFFFLEFLSTVTRHSAPSIAKIILPVKIAMTSSALTQAGFGEVISLLTVNPFLVALLGSIGWVHWSVLVAPPTSDHLSIQSEAGRYQHRPLERNLIWYCI